MADAQTPQTVFGRSSIRVRSRTVLVIVCLLTSLPLLFAAVRLTSAESHATTFEHAYRIGERCRDIQISLERVRAGLWRYEAESNVDSGQSLRSALDALARSHLLAARTIGRELQDPAFAKTVAGWVDSSGAELLPKASPLGALSAAVGRTRRAIDPVIVAGTKKAPVDEAVRKAHYALSSAETNIQDVQGRARKLMQDSLKTSVGALSYAGRDQLVFFLLLVFIGPLIVGFGPGLIAAPLSRLRAVANQIGTGRMREVRISGRDEVSELAQILQRQMTKLEKKDALKTRKIFEMRKLLRAVLHHIREPVLVIGRQDVIDYANEQASDLFGQETHHLERKPLDEVCFAPDLLDAIESARVGESNDAGVDISLEVASGQVRQYHVFLGAIEDQTGRATRVVLVFS